MPVTPTYPGVYIEEVPSGVHTITGVATSIAAFFGRTARGFLNKAVRCLSYSDFLREFGSPHPLSDLAQSVRQFFDNGGSDCYVVRLAKGASCASINLTNLLGDNVLIVTAKNAGKWAHDVKLEIDYNTQNPDDTFNLAVIYEVNDKLKAREDHSNLSMNPLSPRFAPIFVTQSSKLIDLNLHDDMLSGGANATDPGAFINDKDNNTPAGFSQSLRLFKDDAEIIAYIKKLLKPASGDEKDVKSKFKISINGGDFIPIDLMREDDPIDVTAWDVAGADRSDVINDLKIAINYQLHETDIGLNVAVEWRSIDSKVLLRLTSATDPYYSVSIQRAVANDFAGPMLLGVDQGGIEVVRYSNMRPVFTGTAYIGGITFPDNFILGIVEFANLVQKKINKITVAGNDITLDLKTLAPSAKNYEQAPNGFDGVREKLRIIAQEVNKNPNVPCSAELWGYHLVFRKKLGAINDKVPIVTSDDANFGDGFETNTRRYVLGNAGTSSFQSGSAIGNDGTVPGISEYQGNPNDHTGFYALDMVDLFNLMVLPGDREIGEPIYTQLIGPASNYCAQKRAFLLLDAPDSWSDKYPPIPNASAANLFRTYVIKDHSAVFYPKVRYSDAGLKKLIGPSGMIAGLMARTDSTRGVWKAPAGIEAALRNVLDIEVNLTDMENGVLNKLGVNCIRKFPSGIVNWGARTLAGSDDNGSEWKYIPIRRLALFLEESLFRGTKWVVFEPNDEPLWAKIRLNVGAFMMRLFRQGAFQGSTPDKAFYVKCDEETTPQADRDLGIVNIEVGFAPLKPAEFVIIKIQQMAGQLEQ